MGLFSLDDNKSEYGVIIEIGSGSVLAAIVESSDTEDIPTIVWSRREYTPIKQVGSLDESMKSVMTSFMNVIMLLDSKGRKKLQEHSPKSKISRAQFTVSAPWSYTVSKTISYKREEDFTLSRSFLSELLRMAHRKMEEELKENEKMNDLGLKIVSRIMSGVEANGYSVKITGKQRVNSVKITELSVINQDGVVEVIEETRDKLFPKANLQQYSFMAIFFYTVLDIYSTPNECCLVDVTYEATEVGIVRNGVLQYCTHTPYGSASLAREISEVLSVPLKEAHDYLREPDFDTILDKCSAKQKAEIETVFSSYQDKLSELFRESGDKLSAPKLTFMHTSQSIGDFFKTHVKESVDRVTGTSHVIHDVTADIIDRYYKSDDEKGKIKIPKDTGLLISAQFFHKQNEEYKFEQL